jgi:hypothetical protein
MTRKNSPFGIKVVVATHCPLCLSVINENIKFVGNFVSKLVGLLVQAFGLGTRPLINQGLNFVHICGRRRGSCIRDIPRSVPFKTLAICPPFLLSVIYQNARIQEFSLNGIGCLKIAIGHIPTLFGFMTALEDLYLGKYYLGAAGTLDFRPAANQLILLVKFRALSVTFQPNSVIWKVLRL